MKPTDKLREPVADTAQSDEAAFRPLEEYGSVTVTLDHLNREPREDGHTVTNVVFSTETAFQSLLSQVGYFDRENNAALSSLADPDFFEIAAKGLSHDVVFVYTPNSRKTNVIVSAELYATLLGNPVVNAEGTSLGLHAGLLTLAQDLFRTAIQEGGDKRLQVWTPIGG